MDLSNLKYSIIVMAIFTISCSPDPVLRLMADEAEDENIIKYRGMEYLYSESEESSVILAYYRYIGNRMARYSQDDDSENGEWRKILVDGGSAINPESVLLNIDKQRSRTDARERTNTVLDGIASGLSAAGEAATASQVTSTERVERELRRTRRAAERAERRENHYRSVSNLNDSRLYWETDAMRTTDQFLSQWVSRVIEITVDVNGEEHQFRYIQQRYEP